MPALRQVVPARFPNTEAPEVLQERGLPESPETAHRHESLDTLKHYAKLTITDLKSAHARCHPREKDSLP